MERRFLILASLLSLSMIAPLGCSVESAPAEDEIIAETQEELTLVAKSLVGKYYTHSPAFGGFARLTLDKNGKYTASVEAGTMAICFTSPCLLPENGTWNASKVGGKIRLRIRPAGGASRYYVATKSAAGLSLARNGSVENLTLLDAGSCLDDADCQANEQCGHKLCAMWCAVDDPFCCGPSTCEPKSGGQFCGGFAGIPCGPNETCVDDPNDDCDPKNGGADCGGICQPTTPPPPPQPPSCWGAWLDENGLCRTPSDGVYPPECCAGPACGPTHCAAGLVCCNPLSGICTPPGGLCAQ
jgi:hypothetical protein